MALSLNCAVSTTTALSSALMLWTFTNGPRGAGTPSTGYA
jgi:hypothetical protein